MDPVQYMIHLVEQGKTPIDAMLHASQRWGETLAQLEQRIMDARSNARDLLDATEAFDV
jgi:hypothetical protein